MQLSTILYFRYRILVLAAMLIIANVISSQGFNSFESNNKADKRQAAEQAVLKVIDFYNSGEFEAVFQNADEAINLCESSEFNVGLAAIYRIKGIISRITEDYPNALNYLYSSIEYSRLIEDLKGESMALNHIGAIFRVQGNYPGALDYFINSLKNAEALSDTSGMAVAHNNIGIVYFYQENYEKALEYYYNSLFFEQQLNDEYGISVSYINIGTVYKELGDYDNALDYYLNALTLAKEHQEEDHDRDGIGLLYNETGSIYMYIGNYDLSLEYLHKALDIFKDIDSKYRISECKQYFGELSLKKGRLSEARNYFLSALQNAEAIGALDLISSSHNMLNNVYDKLNNTSKAYYHFRKHIEARDSLFNEDNTKKMVQSAMLYEFEKQMQETKLEQARKDAIADEKVRRQVLLRNFLIAGSGLLGLLLLFIFRGYNQKRKSNILITEKNALLEQVNEEVRAQKDEIESQRDVLFDQKEYIEQQKKKIEDSILYAKHIQSAVILSEKLAKTLFSEFFVIFRPKEVVSGDFYWAAKIENKIIVAVADCTGHGVPGAFMSMLGVSFFNEIVIKNKIIDPAQILEELRKVLIDAMVKNADDEIMQREGMYINLAVIDENTNECMWSGARTPLLVVRNDNSPVNKERLEEYKHENSAVAMRLKMRKFTCKKIQLMKGDKIYMFSDGFIDQFGGPEGKKFTSKQLKKIISQTADKPLIEQKQAIEEILDKWQNPADGESFEQLDDITLMGIQI